MGRAYTSYNGKKVPSFSPTDFFGLTVIDPRFTERGKHPGRRRAGGPAKTTVVQATPQELTAEEKKRRLYNRDW